MAFRFRMQKVLEYREQLEEQAKVRLAKDQAQLLDAQNREFAKKTDLEQIQLKLSDTNLMDNGERWLTEQYAKGLRQDLTQIAMEIKTFLQIVDEDKAYLAARSIDKKMLEKLKEHQKHDYLRAEQIEEQHFNDEISTLRYKVKAF